MTDRSNRRWREFAARVLLRSPASAVIRRRRRTRLTIVCYHRVLPKCAGRAAVFDSLIVEPEVFDAHVRHYAEHYRCTTQNRSLGASEEGNGDGRPRLVITFDDGYWDNFAYARPILARHGVPATFFVITSLVDSTKAPWYDRLANAMHFLRQARIADHREKRASRAAHERWLDGCIGNQSQSLSEFVGEAKRLDPARRRSLIDAAVAAAEAEGWRRDESDRVMNGDELRLLAREGHEIASHTRTHPILPQLPPHALHDELAGAKADLERIVGHEVVSLAYPNGDFNQDVIAAAQRAGYGNAVTTESGLNDALTDPYRMKRIFISQARTQGPAAAVSLPLLELELSGLADTLFLRRWRRS